MQPVSSLSWAENEVRFPVRFAKNRTSLQLSTCGSASRRRTLLHFALLCLSRINEPGVCWFHPCGLGRNTDFRVPNKGTRGRPSTDPQLKSLWNGSTQTNFSL